MAEFIGDGYDESVRINGFRIEYRPLPSHSRRIFCRRLNSTPRHHWLWRIRELFRKQIVDPDHIEIVESWTKEDQAKLFRHILGIDSAKQQKADEHNLRSGIRLLVVAPWLYRVTCEECRAFAFDPMRGVFTRDIFGNRIPQGGEVVCEGGGHCPAGHYNRDRRLSEKNRQCLRHYLECRAVGEFPDDPYVRHNARIIEWAINRARRDRCLTSLKRR